MQEFLYIFKKELAVLSRIVVQVKLVPTFAKGYGGHGDFCRFIPEHGERQSAARGYRTEVKKFIIKEKGEYYE